MIEKVIPFLGYLSNAVIERLRYMTFLNMKKIVLTHFLFMLLVRFLMSSNDHKDFTKK
jgi:hypothetical protein